VNQVVIHMRVYADADPVTEKCENVDNQRERSAVLRYVTTSIEAVVRVFSWPPAPPALRKLSHVTWCRAPPLGSLPEHAMFVLWMNLLGHCSAAKGTFLKYTVHTGHVNVPAAKTSGTSSTPLPSVRSLQAFLTRKRHQPFVKGNAPRWLQRVSISSNKMR